MRDEERAPAWVYLTDQRVGGIVNAREAAGGRRRRQDRINAMPVLEPTSAGVRSAARVLVDFGPPTCPPGVVVSAALMREARRLLGWTQAQAADRLGFESVSGGKISRIEKGAEHAPRHARLLMVRALQDLAAQQRGGRRMGP